MKEILKRVAKALRKELHSPELERQLAGLHTQLASLQTQLASLQTQLASLQTQLADQEVRVTAILALLLNQQQLTLSEIAVLRDIITKVTDRIRAASPRGDGGLGRDALLTGTPEIDKDL